MIFLFHNCVVYKDVGLGHKREVEVLKFLESKRDWVAMLLSKR